MLELQGEPDDIVREKCLLAVEKVCQNKLSVAEGLQILASGIYRYIDQ